MLMEAIQYVFDQGFLKATSALARVLKEVPSDGRTIVIEHAGKLIDRAVPPPLRAHSVDSVNDLVNAAKRWTTDPVIWVSERNVVLAIDDKDRRETVTLPLIKSHTFKTIESLRSHDNGRMDQTTFVRLLRRDFRKSPDAATMLSAVRKIKFKSYSDGHSDIGHGNESLGKTIENEVTGAQDFPELMIVPCSVYMNPGEEIVETSIGMDMEIDAKTQRFILRPMPDETEAAIARALASIQQRIGAGLGKEVPVFYGSP